MATEKTETTAELVKFPATGEQREFAGKKKLIKESGQDSDGNVVTKLYFRNGEVRVFTMPMEMLGRFAAHGAEQKLGDEIAGLSDLDDAVLATDKLIERLTKRDEAGKHIGEWNAERAASDGMAGTSILARALAKIGGKDLAVVVEWLKPKSPADKAALRANPQVAEVIRQIEAERAAKGKGGEVDSSKLLGELGGLGAAAETGGEQPQGEAAAA